MDESTSERRLGELRSAVGSLWLVQNRARLEMLERFAEIDRVGVASLGLRKTTDLIRQDLRCSVRFANAVVRDLDRYAGGMSLTGEPLKPPLPLVAAGLRDGLFSFEHASVIAETIEKLPLDTRAECGAAVEERLVEQAAGLDPNDLRTLARRITALLDEDGPVPNDELQYRRRGVWFTELADGSSQLHGILTATATESWKVIFASLGAERNTSLDEDGHHVLDADGKLVTGPDELGKDTRTVAQRQHDALDEAGRLLLENGKLPDHAGLPAELLVTIDLQDLEARTGQATTHHGGHLSVQQVLHLAAELNVIPVVLDQELGLVQHGRGRRIASTPQRKAVFARDRGCSFPGCTKTAGQSQVHHMTEWINLGETNLENLTITCGWHTVDEPRARRAISTAAPRQGWKAQLKQGIPHWTPPPWHDPEQKPRRNYQHHPELLTPSRT